MPASKWDTAFLDEMKHTGDPLADEVVNQIYKSYGDDPKAVYYVYNQLVQNLEWWPTKEQAMKALENEDLFAAAWDFYNHCTTPPEWMDESKLEIGRRLYEANTMMAYSVLGCYSLPVLYTCGKGGTQVLAATGQLNKQVPRRILQTMDMVGAVMSPDGMRFPSKDSPEKPGKGIRLAARVRLMHAMIRYLIQLDPEMTGSTGDARMDAWKQVPWEGSWGTPIGQEYMGATLQTFSYTIIDGLEQVKVRVSDEQKEAYIHTWNVIGRVMGVDERFLTGVKTLDDSKGLLDTVLARTQSETEREKRDGEALTNALVDFMSGMIKEESLLKNFYPMKRVPKLMVLQFNSQKDLNILGQEYTLIDRLVAVPIWIVAGLGSLFSSKLKSGKHNFNRWMSELIEKAIAAFIEKSYPETSSESKGIESKAETAPKATFPPTA